MARDQLIWIDSPSYAEFRWPSGPISRFRVGDVEFRCGFGESHDGDFAIRKDRVRIEEYLEIVERFDGDNVVELGIGSGGSVALATLVTLPRKLVAVDLEPDRVEALDELIARRRLSERVRLYYGTDQSDQPRLRSILDDEFGDEPLGLVIDDASHRLGETRASFEALFPRLRPGGLYLIEDWNHQHLTSRDLAAALADPTPELKARVLSRMAAGPLETPLSRLVIELILIQAESDRVIREVRVDRRWALVCRGPGDLDRSGFRLSDFITNDFGLLPSA